MRGCTSACAPTATLVGPCWRCVGPARVEVVVDSSEFQADGRTADDPFDEDFDSSYVAANALDVGLWTRDAIAEVLPAMILCREDCAGLCPTCGVDRNVERVRLRRSRRPTPAGTPCASSRSA